MSIRNKAISLICIVVTALATLMVGSSYILTTKRYSRLEAQETKRQVRNIQNELNLILSHLEAIAGDWAPWDDTYRFIADGNTAYVASNLTDTTLNNLHLNFMLFFRADGTVAFSQYFDPDPSRALIQSDQLLAALEKYPALFKHPTERSRISGIVMTPAVPCLAAAHPIVTSNFGGPIRGTLVVGRLLDADEIEKIGSTNQTMLTITSLAAISNPPPIGAVQYAQQHPGQIHTTPLDGDTMSGVVALPDLSGAPAALLEIKRQREIYRYSIASWRQNTLILMGFVLVFIVLLVYLLDRAILSRLGDLTERVNQIAHCANSFEPMEIESRDEIGQLAESINTMLQALQLYHSEQIDSENFLRELLDSINCGIMVVDAEDHHIVDINKTAVALLQRQRRDIIGKQCHQLVCPNEIGNCPVTDQKKTIDLSERYLLQADGNTLPIIKSVSTIERRGRTYLIESFINISKLKQAQQDLQGSEERYRQFFEEDFTGDFLMSMDGRIIDCNPAFAKMFGLDYPEQRRALLQADNYMAKNDRQALLARLQKEGRLVGIELELTPPERQPLYCIGNIIGQFDANGTLSEIRGYLFDDTKRVLLEKDLRRAHKMEAIGTLAGGIAHDFNNILAGIMGYTELAMVELPEDHAAVERLQLVVKSATRAKDLVHQILAFSRQTEGESQVLSPSPIIKEVVKLMRASLPATIEICEHLESSAKIMANPVQIQHMVMNLCTNAGFAMKKNGGRLLIRASDAILDKAFTDRYPGVQPGAFFCISVTDTGPGIAPDVIDRIFDPFFSTKDKNEGTGLGLSVVHGIASKLKGAITVESSRQGARFDIYLPVADSAQPSMPTSPAKGLTGGTESIVFIDDEEPLVEIGTHMLGSLGYRVTGYTDSQKALVQILANTGQVDLVITDMTMPGLTGLALAHQVQQRRPNLPVILCIGYSESISELDVKSMGIQGYVMKPMVIKELAAEIRKVLDSVPPQAVAKQATGT